MVKTDLLKYLSGEEIEIHTAGLVTHHHRLRHLITTTHTWSRLRELTLEGVYPAALDLVALMRNHTTSLKFVDITGSELCDPEVLGGLGDQHYITREKKEGDWIKVLE